MLVAAQSVFVGNAKLIALEPSGNIGVGLRVHIGVDADAHRCNLAARQRHCAQHIQLGFALDVEASDTGIERLAHLGAGFAHARKNHLVRLATGSQHTAEFATRDDVKAATRLGEDLQHTQRRIGFHRVMHQRIASRKSFLVWGQSAQHGGLGIHEQRRAVLRSQGGQSQLFAKQLTITA